MSNYLGIVIKQSLKNASAIKSNIIARKNVHNWLFYLVSVEESAFHSHIKALQDSMVTDDEWYAHYFRRQSILIAGKQWSIMGET